MAFRFGTRASPTKNAVVGMRLGQRMLRSHGGSITAGPSGQARYQGYRSRELLINSDWYEYLRWINFDGREFWTLTTTTFRTCVAFQYAALPP